MKSFAWIAMNEAIDENGFYLEDGPAVYEAERAELKEMGAPCTEQIQFISILPEDRDSSMVEALVPDEFIRWAKDTESLAWYDDEGEAE